MYPPRPSHPTDGLTLSGCLSIKPALDEDQVGLLAALAFSSFRAALDDRPSALVDRLAPGHPDGPSSWLPCEDGCCLAPDDRGLARVEALEPWLRHIVGTLFGEHDFTGAVVMHDHADGTFSALSVEGSRVRRRSLLQSPARGRGRGGASRPRLVAGV